MTKEQYLNLKQELKDLAVKIRETKNSFKGKQREFSKFEKENGLVNEMRRTVYEIHKDEYYKLYKGQRDDGWSLNEMRYNYRHMHIVYCFARGRTILEIEPRVKEGNDPSWFEIKRLSKKYEVRPPIELEVTS